MQSHSDTAQSGDVWTLFRRADTWLDQRGTWAWFAILILAFFLFPPLGLALLAYMIWGKRMFSRTCSKGHFGHDRMQTQEWNRHPYQAGQPTGNVAFDRYKAEALRRLEEEHEAFEAFLHRLRNSKDKSEFDTFMDERARATSAQDEASDQTSPEVDDKPSDKTRPGEY